MPRGAPPPPPNGRSNPARQPGVHRRIDPPETVQDGAAGAEEEDTPTQEATGTGRSRPRRECGPMVTRQAVMENPGKVMLVMLYVLNFFTYHGLMIFTSVRAVFSSH
jgi:hypothetical protein